VQTLTQLSTTAMPERSSSSSSPSSSSNTSSYPVSGARHYRHPPTCTPAHRRPAAAGAHFPCFAGTKAQIPARGTTGTPRPARLRIAALLQQVPALLVLLVQKHKYWRAALPGLRSSASPLRCSRASVFLLYSTNTDVLPRS
jgi:hypothetical protein